MDTNEMANGFYGEMNPIQQMYSDTCAIKSQQLILNDFGVQCTEDDLVRISIDHGWYTGNGTLMPDVGNLLENAGISCTRQDNANVFDLVNELSQGHKIIVGVDADELWYDDSFKGKFTNWLNDFFHGDTPNHALIVAGIDTSDPDNIQVILTDPGMGDYCKAYPIDQFMDAWSDSNCYMVSTDCAVPQTLPEMAHFNPEIGHIDNIGGVSYPDFQVFNDMSHGIPCNYMPFDNGWFNPMNSYMDAYFDYAHNDIMFNQMFTHDYMFNQYIMPDLVTPYLHDTFDYGMSQVNFNPMNDWNHYSMMNDIPVMTNFDYGNFLDQSINDFQMMGDYNSMAFCEQQHMMLDYCNHFGYDFHDTFYAPSFMPYL